MRREQAQGLVYYRSDMLQAAGARNFFMTRQGGFSQGQFAELNLSFRVGDDPELVKKNYRKLKAALGIKTLITVLQGHGSRVLDLDLEDLDEDRLRGIEADGIVTARQGVAIGVLVADCYPLIMLEPEKRVLAAIHCGWRGIVSGVIESALRAIAGKGGRPENIVAALGPGVCKNCYTVDDPVIAEFSRRFPQVGAGIWSARPGGYGLDLKAAIMRILQESGVEHGLVDELGMCTSCGPVFFSHRRDQGRSGRQLALAML